jgi:hypothetical protein
MDKGIYNLDKTTEITHTMQQFLSYEFLEMWIVYRNIRLQVKKATISRLQAVEAPRVARSRTPTLLTQTGNRWRQGCQPYAPAALYTYVSL